MTRMLIHSARAVIVRAKVMPPWLEDLLRRRPLTWRWWRWPTKWLARPGHFWRIDVRTDRSGRALRPMAAARAQADQISNLRQQPMGMDASKSVRVESMK